jgi:hypothetical protein
MNKVGGEKSIEGRNEPSQKTKGYFIYKVYKNEREERERERKKANE